MTDNSARKWWALVAIAASVLVVGLDLTVLNLALPTIATDLHASNSDLQWISDAYSLVLAAAMLPAGLGSATLLRSARTAFVSGLDTMLWICGGIAVVSAILALIFLPRRADRFPRIGAAAATGATGATGAPGESGLDRAQLEV
jgi:MFS family permease